MRPVAPDLHPALCADLLDGMRPAAALRAAAALPDVLRSQAARAILFIGVILLARDDEMKTTALAGLRRAVAVVDAIRDIYAMRPGGPAIHPAAAAIIGAALDGHRETVESIDALRAVFRRTVGTLDGGRSLDVDAFHAAYDAAYSAFLPAVSGLLERSEVAAEAERARGEAAARLAERAARAARGRIDSVARSVRTISVNARVEAARAGGSGRAFGVIADEIKRLAEQSAEASTDIGSSIEDIMASFRAT